MNGRYALAVPLLLALVSIVPAEPSSASSHTGSGGCIIAKLPPGTATTYNPGVSGWKTGGMSLATGGTYNANGYEAALQLDFAKRWGCGYGSRKVCHAAVEGNGKSMIVLINDNGPMCADPQTAAKAKDCKERTSRVIDLNEKAMRYMSDGKYGNNSGTIPNVTVTLLCNFDGKLGPLEEQERGLWANKTFPTDQHIPFTPGMAGAPGGQPGLLGSPSPYGQPTQGYQQPQFGNYQQSPGTTQPGSYFSQSPTGGVGSVGGVTPIPPIPVYQSSSTADYLLSILSGKPVGSSAPSTAPSPFRITLGGGTQGIQQAPRQPDTVIVTPLGQGGRPAETFTGTMQGTGPSQTDSVLTQTLASLYAQLQYAFSLLRALLGLSS